ncbi:MAG: tRNA glutamyl-Q(34) synthetase GluQRS [Pseudomonadota bacterium]
MRTRFAPSPTGPLHLGHAFSALRAARLAGKLGGEFLLRIEDLDRARARPAWEDQIYDDLAWLGLTWPKPVLRQSERSGAYGAALDQLWDMGLLFPCTCSRRDIAAAASAPHEGDPPMGPDGIVYPGTCRDKPKPAQMPTGVLRLDMSRAVDGLSELTWNTPNGPQSKRAADLICEVGDVVLTRLDMPAAYHLAVVVDDGAQGITHVVRGADLEDATPIHVLLQRLLNLPTPIYHHHRLIRDESGKRLAKRNDARSISRYRSEGLQPREIWKMVGL